MQSAKQASTRRYSAGISEKTLLAELQAYVKACVEAFQFSGVVLVKKGAFGLPVRLNTFLLSAIELLCLRSGHAYRTTHLHHHKAFPHDDDIEAQIACGSLWRMVCLSPFHQFRIWQWSLNSSRRAERVWLITEVTGKTFSMMKLLECLHQVASAARK